MLKIIYVVIAIFASYSLIEQLEEYDVSARRKRVSIVLFIIIAGVMGYMCDQKFGGGIIGYIYFGVTLLMAILGIVDLYYKHIPTELVGAGIIVGIVTLFVNPNVIWYIQLIQSIGVFVIIWGVSKISRGAVGEGDAWVSFMLALFLGWQHAFLVLVVALFLSGVTGLILLILKKVGKKTMMPFIPFMLLAQMALILL